MPEHSFQLGWGEVDCIDVGHQVCLALAFECTLTHVVALFHHKIVGILPVEHVLDRESAVYVGGDPRHLALEGFVR